MESLAVISCIFGTKFKYVYPAPLPNNCFFFTNNPELKKEIITSNWEYIYVPFELSDDYLDSSLQSKYIKFLEFLNDYPDFVFSTIIYVDHKLYLKKEHIKKLLEQPGDYKILLRQHESNLTILDEIEEAKSQPRYSETMEPIEQIVHSKIQSKELFADTKTHNTGLLMYNNYNQLLPMLHSIYKTCQDYKNPECQIVFEMVSQPWNQFIKTVPFHSIKIIWTNPLPLKIFIIDNYIIIIVLFLLFLKKLKNLVK